MANEDKKPFDKKKWRNEKYSKKVKGKLIYCAIFVFVVHKRKCLSVDQWQDKRKKYIQSKYFRMLQKEGKVNNPNMVPLGEQNSPSER